MAAPPMTNLKRSAGSQVVAKGKRGAFVTPFSNRERI
jgi:hypothetical protein